MKNTHIDLLSFYRIKIKLYNFRRSQLGLSILGALLALVIGSLLTIPVVNAFLDSQRKARVEINLQDMRTIIADAQRNFGNSDQYVKLTTAVAVQSGVIPSRLRVAGTNSAQNTYNGDIQFFAMSMSALNDSIMMYWNKVQRADCADIIFGIEQLSRGLYVNGWYPVKPVDGTVDTALVGDACEASPETTIQVIFGRKS